MSFLKSGTPAFERSCMQLSLNHEEASEAETVKRSLAEYEALPRFRPCTDTWKLPVQAIDDPMVLTAAELYEKAEESE